MKIKNALSVINKQMDKQEILKKITEVFIDTIDEENVQLTFESTANDVDGWDSLSHIQLVVAIEKAFKLRFLSAEIQRWKNVGEMVDSIAAKLQQGQ
jgi:acyl carrier protein